MYQCPSLDRCSPRFAAFGIGTHLRSDVGKQKIHRLGPPCALSAIGRDHGRREDQPVEGGVVQREADIVTAGRGEAFLAATRGLGCGMLARTQPA